MMQDIEFSSMVLNSVVKYGIGYIHGIEFSSEIWDVISFSWIDDLDIWC